MGNRILINPSILNANFDDLEGEIERVAKVSDQLHLDIMDNKFVPNFTFHFKQALEIIAFSKLPVDAHLMVEDADVIAPKYAENGCESVTFHFEAANNVKQTISHIKSNGSKVGLAIKPGTKFAQVEEFIDELDLLLIMTVEPGFGGQSFMTDQMEKVSQARAFINEGKAFPLLQVDGGISESTIETAASAGANCFVAGSAVYKSSDPAETIVKLRSLASNSFRG
ncbi:MAG: ribulose-phosphate 3-epimerase [Actinobacteria bacterium]|nr:ribulose-phosphate 3-epimerase [Actinomycetota bacterium]